MKLNNRNVVDAEIDGVDSRDYPDFCDAYFCYAVWEDTKEDGKFIESGMSAIKIEEIKNDIKNIETLDKEYRFLDI